MNLCGLDLKANLASVISALPLHTECAVTDSCAYSQDSSLYSKFTALKVVLISSGHVKQLLLN